jgi:hypothetical protein
MCIISQSHVYVSRQPGRPPPRTQMVRAPPAGLWQFVAVRRVSGVFGTHLTGGWVPKTVPKTPPTLRIYFFRGISSRQTSRSSLRT